MIRSVVIASLIAFGAVAALSTPIRAQRENPGLANIVCQLGINGSGTYGFGGSDGEIHVVDHGANPTTHIGLATITKLVGKSVSLTFPYVDTDHNGHLNCGDEVVQ
jgi:hypothetical protein